MIILTKEAGKITGSLRQEFENMTDGKYYVDIQPLDTRNLRQNAFLWAIIYPEFQKAFEHAGNSFTIDELHFAAKNMFLPKKRKKNKITGKYNTEPGSTKNLSKKQFSEYIRMIEQYSIDRLEYTLDIKDDKDLLFYDTIIKN